MGWRNPAAFLVRGWKMNRIFWAIAFLFGLLVTLTYAHLPAHPQWQPEQSFNSVVAASKAAATAMQPGQSTTQPMATSTPPPKPTSFDEAIRGMERLPGLFTLYRDPKKGRLLAEIQPNQLNTPFLAIATLESGVGEAGIYSGLPIADMLFTFRKVGNRLQFSLPNVYFRTDPGDPLQRSVQRSFSSSVLQSLPILSTHLQRKSYLIDLGPLFLTDLPGITPVLPFLLGAAYAIDTNKSYFNTVKNFDGNTELETVYGFTGGGGSSSERLPAFVTTLPDSRSFNLRIHYSLSALPGNNGYRPRLADERVGYFLTAYQNFSDSSPRTPFVRYINRWHLEKQDPDAALSAPKEPIVFWIENTVPLEYRDGVREGIEMWNKAFEKIGFKDAIVAKQMPDNARWDPADIRYNTIRWLTSYDAGFVGIGPSRVNPLTGQILDADILIDASFARYLKQQFESIVAQNERRLMPDLAQLAGVSNLCGYGIDSQLLEETGRSRSAPRWALRLLANYDLCYGLEAKHQLSVGAVALSTLQNVLPGDAEMQEYVRQYLRMLVAHEVGHTLGLRHNFRASSMLAPTDLHKTEITRSKGLVGSVMDYSSINLAPQGVKQGDYFTQTLGPYDEWAIAYGYAPSPDNRTPQSERRFLEAIARRAPEPDLAYATDEDVFARLDPQTNVFDLSSDLLTYAPWQLDNALRMWERVDRRYPLSGQSYNDVRVIFDDIFSYYFQYARFLVNYIGGQSFNRYRGGDASDRLPFEPIALEQQRQALKLIQTYVFDESKFQFSPQLLNKLAPARWSTWGESPEILPLEYPIYDRIFRFQSLILRDLLSPTRLSRLRNTELKTKPGEALTIPELLNTVENNIWSELLQTVSKLKLSSIRRGLQREHLDLLSRMILRQVAVPEDARSVAWYELRQLQGAVDTALRRRRSEMDLYTVAHLEETRDRINKVLNAQLQSQ
jgi:hypothetical protein